MTLGEVLAIAITHLPKQAIKARPWVVNVNGAPLRRPVFL